MTGPSAPSPAWRAIDAGTLADAVAGLIADRAGNQPDHRLRVAVDGSSAADPGGFAGELLQPLRARGRPVAHVSAASFWRDASLRLEFGRTDVHSFRHDWLDAGALRREVLDPLGADGRGDFLISLRDPITNRATREPRRLAEPGQIVIISGELLLGRGLPFDLAIHLALSPAALTRRIAAEHEWTLPAIAEYERDVRPAESAQIVIKLDDPRHPAIRGG